MADIKLTQDFVEWAAKGRSGAIPEDAIQTLDIFLKQGVNSTLTSAGNPSAGLTSPPPGTPLPWGFGKEAAESGQQGGRTKGYLSPAQKSATK